MEKMKTLTINGITFDIIDDEAVRIIAQNLLEEQKAQARENIGAHAAAQIRTSEVELRADKWVGSENLYSQVVSIDGVTKNSQVDLTPSVEQLATFYHKDLALVAENEEGVVTVYAIGQKPLNNYVIQVTLTEVGG